MKLWRRCGICNEDFLSESDVCPNNVGHVLIVITPQPVEETPPEAPPEPPVAKTEAPVEESKSEGSVVDAEFDPPPGEAVEEPGKLEGEAKQVMEESIDRAREVGGAQMEAEMMGQAPGEPGEEEPCKSQE